jgi:hypothetical protein
MTLNRKKISTIFLILGMTALLIGLGADNRIFSYAAIVFILLSLILGGRWLRPRRK